MARLFAIWLILRVLASDAAIIPDDDLQLIQLTTSNNPSLENFSPFVPTFSTPVANASNRFNNTLPLNSTYNPRCEGDKYGRGMNVDDCLSALGNFKQSGESITFAQRYNPDFKSDMYPLPWRWMGSMQSFQAHG